MVGVEWAAAGVYASAQVLRGDGGWYGGDCDKARWVQRCTVSVESGNRVFVFASDDRMRLRSPNPTSLSHSQSSALGLVSRARDTPQL